MKKVRVTELAFHGGARVRPGDLLTVADTFKASWASDVTPAPAPAAPAPVVETVALAPVEEPKRRSPKKEVADLPDFGGDLA